MAQARMDEAREKLTACFGAEKAFFKAKVDYIHEVMKQALKVPMDEVSPFITAFINDTFERAKVINRDNMKNKK